MQVDVHHCLPCSDSSIDSNVITAGSFFAVKETLGTVKQREHRQFFLSSCGEVVSDVPVRNNQ